jgi:hypothetical protein
LHKEEVGKLWAARSGGKAVFVRVVDRDWTRLQEALDTISPQLKAEARAGQIKGGRESDDP